MLEEGCPLGEVVVSKKVQGVCQQRGGQAEVLATVGSQVSHSHCCRGLAHHCLGMRDPGGAAAVPHIPGRAGLLQEGGASRDWSVLPLRYEGKPREECSSPFW